MRKKQAPRPGAPRLLSRNDLLSLSRFAELTGLSKRTIRHLADRGLLPYEVIAVGGARPIRRYRRALAAQLVKAVK